MEKSDMKNKELIDRGKGRIEVESLNIIGGFSLKSGKCTDDECTLCRQNLLAPSLEDLQKGNLRVLISLGACGHCFHKTCIDAHYAKENYSCPIDKTPWNLSKTVTIADIIKRSKDKGDAYLLESKK